MELCPECGAMTKFGELAEGWKREERSEKIMAWLFVGLGILLALTYIGSLAGIPSIGIGLYVIYSANKKIEGKRIAYLKSLVGSYEYVDDNLQ